MEYRQLGATGTRVSELCFGTWRFGRHTGGVLETDEAAAHELLDAFAAGGGTFIDTATIYGDPNGTSEEYIGSWLETRDPGTGGTPVVDGPGGVHLCPNRGRTDRRPAGGESRRDCGIDERGPTRSDHRCALP